MSTTVASSERSWNVSPAQVRASFWILLASTLLITKIGAYCWNHAIQIPLVNWLNDRSLYPHDPYMEVLARYPFGLWRLVALLARIFPLEGTLRSLFVLERMFALYAAGRLAAALAPGRRLAVVAAVALFAFPLDSMMGHGTMVASSFEHTALALACFLMAAAAFEQQRRGAWAVWLGAGFELTPMYGVFALSYFGAVFVLEADYRSAWKRWLGPCALFLALSSYALYQGVAIARGPSSIDLRWFQSALARGSLHLFPLTWGLAPFARFGGFLAVFLAVIFLGRRETPRLFRQGIVWSVLAILWLVVAFAAAYVLRSPPLMMMQTARATDLLLCLAGVTMIAISAARLERAPGSEVRPAWMVAFGAAFCIWNVPGTWIVAVAVAIVSAPPVWRRVSPWLSPRRLALLLVVWVALIGLRNTAVRWNESRETWDLLFRGPAVPTRELAAWAEAHTPVDAVFLLNTSAEFDFDQFRALAKRSIFTSTEEGAPLYWAPEYVPEWLARLDAIGVTVEYRDHESLDNDFEEAFRDLDDDHVARIKERYRLNYWVVPRDHPSRFPAAWTGNEWKVLEVR